MFRPSMFATAAGGGSAPSLVGVGAVASGAGAIQVAWPEGHQANDIGILLVQTWNQNLTRPNGTTLIETNGYSNILTTLRTRLTAYWIRATSGSMPNIQVSDSGDHQIAAIMAVRGCVTSGSPIHAHTSDTAASGTSVTVPGVTTTVANAFVIAALGATNQSNSNSPMLSGWTNANLTDLTEALDAFALVSNGGGLAAACGIKATAGAPGSTTATLAAAEAQVRMCIALAGV